MYLMQFDFWISSVNPILDIFHIMLPGFLCWLQPAYGKYPFNNLAVDICIL